LTKSQFYFKIIIKFVLLKFIKRGGDNNER